MRGRPGRSMLERTHVAQRWAMPVALVLGVLGFVVLGTLLIAWQTSAGWGYDFVAYYEAAVRLGATGSPYQAATLGGPYQPGPGGLYLYSPVLATLLLPLTSLPLEAATLVWQIPRVALLIGGCALIPASRSVRLATFGIAALTPPVLHDLNLGNVSVIVTFLAVVAWRFLDRPLAGVALAAALALRPTMAVIGASWLLRGSFRPIAWTVLAFALLAAATLPFVGLEGWRDYITVLANVSGVTGVARNVDLGSFFLNAGAPPPVATLVLLCGYGAAIGAILLSLRRDRELGYVVAVMASVILSPLLWHHYLTLLVIPAAFLAKRGHPWALALPLVTWLPLELSGFIALGALLLPFAASAPASSARREAKRVADTDS